jgi:DNA-directed RNA polymerase specialized sigma24 family protein
MQESETWLVAPNGHPEEVLTLQAALRELPEEQRETVFLRVWAGMTVQEIADMLDIPIGTGAIAARC